MSKFLRKMKAMSSKPEDFRLAPPSRSVVVSIPTTTVVVDPKTTVVTDPATTVAAGKQTTVVAGLWRAESNGALFSSTRIRRIELAQHALTHAEECVYDFLWGPKNANKDEYRLTRAGYDRIAKQARITKRNAALIVERLIDKGFILIESPADPLRRLGCEYRVHSYKAVLGALAKQGREWFVRSGNGVLLVRPLTVVVGSETTVVTGQSTTVVAGQPTTVVAGQPTTVADEVPTMVVAATTPLDKEKGIEERQTSSAYTLIHSVARKWSVFLDDDATRKLVRRCQDEDPAATEDEIATFLNIKVLQLRNSSTTRNVIGILLSAVPTYFAKPATELTAYREQKSQERAEQQELARKILDDPESLPDDREWGRKTLADTTPEVPE